MKNIIPYAYELNRLDNGLTLITMPMASEGLVSYWSIVRTGSRDEFESGRTGFAHFFEHMMFRGTKRFPSTEYQHFLTRVGADANAYTTDDLTAYHLAIANEDLDETAEIESDRIIRLDYPEPDFRTEAGAVYGEYRKEKTNPLFAIYEAVREKAFDTHTYGHTTMGYEADIAAMPTMYDYSREFFRRYYRPENTVLFVAGDIDPAGVRKLIERYYADWSPGYEAPAVAAEPEQTTEKRFEVTYDGQTLPILWHAYKIGRFDPRDRLRVAADLLVELAFGETSDVYKQLVIDEQALEFLSAHTNANRDPSLLDIYCRVKNPDEIESVEDALDQATGRFRDQLVDTDKLDALKSRLRFSFLMNLETPEAVAQTLARPIALAGNLDDLEACYAAYETVTPDDLRDAAREILSTDRRTVGLLRARQ